MNAQVTSERYETHADDGGRGVAGRRIYRHVNERIREHWRSYAVDEPVQLHCECSARGCTATLLVEAARFDDVCARAACFVVAPGHVEGGEVVLVRSPDYWLVEEQR